MPRSWLLKCCRYWLTTGLAALAVAGLTAQVLLNLADGDKQRAVTALHEAFLPNVEAIIGALDAGETEAIEPRH
jgi:hypothetical protein